MNRSYAIAGGILGILCAYLLVGIAGCGAPNEPDASSVSLDDSLGKAVMTVRVRPLESQEIAREVIVQGRTDAARRVTVRAETMGTIEAVEVPRGTWVEGNTPLVRLALDTRPETVKRVEAELAARQIEFAAAERLAQQQLSSESALAAARTAVSAAEEALAQIRLDLEHTKVRAPFDGVVTEREVEVGDFVQAGDAIATFLELDPLIVTGEVTEIQVPHVKVGEHGIARLADGTEVDGRIRFVDTDADPGTRTFTVELEVPNPDAAIPAGKTAQIVIETERVEAYEISAAHISIDDEGHFGVKYVDENSVVQFAAIEIVRSTPKTLWLAGLPPELRLITVGQGFTQPGDTVHAVEESVSEE